MSGEPAHLRSPLFRWREHRQAAEDSPLLRGPVHGQPIGSSPLLRSPGPPSFPSALPSHGLAAESSERGPASLRGRVTHRRTRRPPLTRLEELGSSETWTLLLLPLAVFVLLLLPSSPGSLRLPHDRPPQLVCDRGALGLEISSRVPLVLLGSVDLSVTLNRSALPGDTALTPLVFRLSAVSPVSGRTAEVLQGTVPVDPPAFPLARLDPGAMPPTSRFVLNIRSQTNDSASVDLLAGAEVKIVFAGEAVVCGRALLLLVLCSLSLGLLVGYLRALHGKVLSLRQVSAMHRQRSYLECLLPEQVA